MADSDSDAALTEAGGSESDWDSDWDESDWDEDVAAGCATGGISKQELELRCFLVLNMVEERMQARLSAARRCFFTFRVDGHLLAYWMEFLGLVVPEDINGSAMYYVSYYVKTDWKRTGPLKVPTNLCPCTHGNATTFYAP